MSHKKQLIGTFAILCIALLSHSFYVQREKESELNIVANELDVMTNFQSKNPLAHSKKAVKGILEKINQLSSGRSALNISFEEYRKLCMDAEAMQAISENIVSSSSLIQPYLCMLIFSCFRNQAGAQQAFEYLKSPISGDVNDAFRLGMERIELLQFMGIFRDRTTNEHLLRILNGDTKSVYEQWKWVVNADEWREKSGWIDANIRGRAAIALVLSGDADMRAKVQALYEEKKYEIALSASTEGADGMLFTELEGAMAIDQLSIEFDLDFYPNIYSSQEKVMFWLGPHLDKLIQARPQIQQRE